MPRHVPLGQGMVDFGTFFKLYKQAGLAGPVSMHVEYPLFARDEKTMSKEEKNAAAKAIFTRELAYIRKAMSDAGLPA